MLINDDFDAGSWGYKNISHGLLGDASFRYSVFNPMDNLVVSAGFAVSHYFISGYNDLNGNYFTGGLSIGLNYAFNKDLAVFTRCNFSKA